MAKPTLLTLKQSLADRHDSGVLPTDSATLAYWTRLLNRAKDYCVTKLRINFPTTLTTVNGQASAPIDFLLVNKVYDSGNNEITQINQSDKYTANDMVYWISGNYKDGYEFNVPSGRDDTYNFDYAGKVADMVSDSDICVIPDEESVVARAYGMLRKSETDPIGDAQEALDECERRLNEVQDQLAINDNSIGFTLQAGA